MEITDIFLALKGGGAGAIVAAGLLKFMIKDKLKQLDDHGERISKIERDMATKVDLESTADNLQDLINTSTNAITQRIDQVLYKLAGK